MQLNLLNIEACEQFALTERLIITRMATVHASHIEALNDKEYMAFSDQRHRTHDVSSQRKYIESQNTRFLLLDLRLRPGAAEIPCSVGSISVHFDPPNEKADMGLLIIPEFKSRRFGREAWEATMSALFGYGVFKIEAGTPQDNMAMRYIMTQARMRIEGRRFNSFLLDGGKRTDVLLYGRTREA